MTDRDPLDILKERYVNGEITKEQFDQMKHDLGFSESVKPSETKNKMSTGKKIGLGIGVIFLVIVTLGIVGNLSTHNQPTTNTNPPANPVQTTPTQSQPTTQTTANPTVPQNTPQSADNENPLSLSEAYMNDLGQYTSNECGTSASPACNAIVNTLEQDCSNPTLLQVESASCDLEKSSLNMRQSYLNSLSPTISQNWAGYVAESDLYNPQPIVGQVFASWQVVPIPTSNLDQEMAQWVGIGGYANIGGSTDESLIQVGTSSENVCKQVFNSAYQLVPQCTLNYTAWYEIYPDNYETPLMSVNAGDTVEAVINCLPSSASMFNQDTCKGKTQEWTIVIIDETKKSAGITPFFASYSAKFSSSLLTADWIVERRCPQTILSSCDLAVNLPGFGSATFTNSQMNSEPIDFYKYVNLSMTSNGQQSGALLAYPSNLTDRNGNLDINGNSSSFTVTSGYQTTTPPPQPNNPSPTITNATILNEFTNLNNVMQKNLNLCTNSAISSSTSCVNVINTIKQDCSALEKNYRSYFPVCNDPRLQ